MLATHRFPAKAPVGQPPLLIVHGLFGSARNWGGLARRLSATRDVLTVDLRNHGDSPWFPTHSYADMAADLARVIGDTPMDVLGHSMGGKAAMVLALTTPHLVNRLIVADIAPVAYDHTNIHHIHAMRALDLTPPLPLAEADRRLSLATPDRSLRAFFLQSLDLKSTPPRWTLNLDVLEAFMPQIVGWPVPAGQYDGRTLFLSGGASDYVLPAHRDTIKRLFPHARFAKLPGAGHWLHAEKPREFGETVEVFLGGASAGGVNPALPDL